MTNTTLKEFLKLPIAKQISYTTILQHIKAKELIKIPITELTYNDIKIIFKEFQKENPNIELIFCKSLNILKENYLSLPIVSYFQLKNYIEKYFIKLKENEVKLLQSINADTGIWEMAGGNDLNEFSDVLPLSQLAKIYGGYPFNYGKKSYIEIIYLLRMNNKQAQIEQEYQKLKSKK
jgi:hypothetical protein